MVQAPPPRTEQRFDSVPDAAAIDSRRWLRDMGALLALPAMWMDHQPAEIANSLVGVLAGILDLRAAHVRFEGTNASEIVEAWWPPADAPSEELVAAARQAEAAGPGITSLTATTGRVATRVAHVPLQLPWERARILVSTTRPDFPTAIETHLLRIAAGQAVIAFHTARRIAEERNGRRSAEAELTRTQALIRSLVDDIEPSLSGVARRLRQAVQAATSEAHHRITDDGDLRGTPGSATTSTAGPSRPQLSRREAEVLGLLAQGLSNKEIAGVLWLSDRTVERHITSLYRKIGVARRSEATAFALGHPSL